MNYLTDNASLAHLDECTRHIAVAPLPEANPADVRGSILIEVNVPALSPRTWDAISTRNALNAWFAPVTGDFRRGGTYHVSTTSWGTILEIVPERRFSATWNFDDRTSILNVDLTPPFEPELEETSTLISVAHGSDLRSRDWNDYGVLAVGAAWDAMLFKLSSFLSAPADTDPAANIRDWEASNEASSFMRESLRRWTAATIDYGVDEATAQAMHERSLEALSADE